MSTVSVSPYLPCLAIALLACTANDQGTQGASSAESDVVGVTSYEAEAWFRVAGKPTRRVRTTIKLLSNVPSSSVKAYKNTTYDEGGFQHDTCVTSIAFPAATAAVEVLDDATGAVITSYTKAIDVGAGFDTETHAWSTCSPHHYPDLAQDSTVSVNLDPIAFPDGNAIDDVAMSFDIHVAAVRNGEAWTLTGATLDPYRYSNLNHSVSFHLPSGAIAFTSIYAAGKHTPHTVTAHVDVADCTLTDEWKKVGDPQPGTFHFAIDYPRKLEEGARVFVKYNERLGFWSGQPPWTDDQQIELSRSGDAWKGEITVTGTVRPVKRFENEEQRDAVSEAGSLSSMLYVFRVQHADGRVEWENGSAAKWGNYRTTGDQRGLYGYYGLRLPASCDGLGRTAALDAEVDAYR
jgi:hypothetical protein